MVAVSAAAALLGICAPAAFAGTPYTKGDVFAGVGSSTIKEFSPSGALVQTLTTGSATYNTGMCFDGSGNLYATLFGSNSMTKFDNSGNILIDPFGSGYNTDPESCVVDKTGNLYVGEADGAHTVLKFDPSGTLLDSFNPDTTGFRGTDWVDLAADQKTLFYAGEGTLIKRFDVSTHTQLADFATLPSSPCYALRILSDGGVLVACSSAAYRTDSSGTVIKTYTAAEGTGNLFSLNLDPDGTTFWTGDFGNGEIFHFDIASGTELGHFNSSPNTGLFGLAVFGEVTVGGPPPSACTMTSTKNTTQFKTTGGQSIQKEDALSTDLTASQKLVLRSLSGPSQYFRLTSLTSASCHDVTKYPAEEGTSVNTFNGTGTGSFGTDRTHASPGFSIKVELADRGDTTGSDDTSVDWVNFTVTNGSGAVVWTGKGTLTGGSQEMSGPASTTAPKKH